MATVLVEGFDHYTLGQQGIKFWNGFIFAMVPGRGFGGQAIQVIANNDVWKQLPASYSTVIAGAALWIASPSLGHTLDGAIMVLRSNGVPVANLLMGPDQRLYIQDNANRVIAGGTTVVPFNSWFYVELKIVVGLTGSGELHLNGGSEIASTTGNFGTADINQILFEMPSTLSGMLVDDVVVLDASGSAPQNDFIGDVRIVTLFPVADATYTDWTPKTGTDHFAMVDEHIIDGDGSYVKDANAGDKDSYLLDTFLSGTIFSAQLNIGARKGDASLRQIAPLIRQAGTDHVGSTVTLSSDYSFYSTRYDNDMLGAPWLAATINANEWGQELIA